MTGNENWIARAFDLALQQTRDEEVALNFAARLLRKSGGDPDFKSKDAVGIAALPQDLEDVDPMNPEDAINYDLSRYLGNVSSTGDPVLAAVVDDAANSSDAKQLRLEQTQSAQELKDSLFGGDSGFDQLDSYEGRFKAAIAVDNRPAAEKVLNELIDKRVQDAGKNPPRSTHRTVPGVSVG